MARDFAARNDTDKTDPTNFPDGRLLDSNPPSANNGTAIVEAVLGDVIQFFYKLLRDGGITPTGNADTDTANQFLDGLVAKIRATSATTLASGTVELANQAEVDAGTDNSRAITPNTFATRLNAFRVFNDSAWQPVPEGADADATFTDIFARQWGRVVVVTGRFRVSSETGGAATIGTVPNTIASSGGQSFVRAAATPAIRPATFADYDTLIVTIGGTNNRDLIVSSVQSTPSGTYSFNLTYITSTLVPG